MKIEGIDGDVTHQEHKNWLDISSLQWGVGRGISTPVGSAKNREASEPSISEVVVTKLMDASSVKLFTEACTGQKGKKVQIHLVSTGNPGKTYMEYTLENALVSGYSVSTNGDRPSESISFNFTKIETKYTPLGEGNDTGSPVTASYDLATTKSA
jgi:type VI secretion system secreted protein Hcp